MKISKFLLDKIVAPLLDKIVISILRRVKQSQELDAYPGISVTDSPPFGWIPIRKLNYAGVVWRVLAPAPAPWQFSNSSEISPSSIEVETPPRCPKCQTEIEERRSFCGGYIWECVGCGFKKRNRDSYYKESKRVEKIARRELEKQNYDSSGI